LWSRCGPMRSVVVISHTDNYLYLSVRKLADLGNQT